MIRKPVEGNVILVVDDEDINLQVAKVILEKNLPCRVITVDNAIEGMEILRRQYIRVVLLDIMMPDVDGIEMLKEIRADSKLKNIPVIMLTASTDKQNIQQAIQLNVKEYIKKPFMPNDLIDRVSKQLVIKKDIMQAKILIVDEDEDNLKSLTRILENHFPHQVLIADSGISGMEILRKTDVNLVIANTEMRFINGFKILDFMHKDVKLQKIPVVLVLNDDDSEMLAKVKFSSAANYITLPFDAEKITLILSETLSGKVHGYSNFSTNSSDNVPKSNLNITV
ncbi:MAG: response regulator [Selenomonadaceae bacterium]|nr:response regulator [Selenomonadaceae bacterium]